MPSDEPIRLAPPDPSWPARFEQEREALRGAIGEWVCGGIHHIGSTAVSGLRAKPIIDILVGVGDLGTARACFEPLADLDYLYAPYLAEEMHWFCKPDPTRRTHHLHLVPADSQRFRDELAFRDRLRADAQIADKYAALKSELAARHGKDREGYTEAKGAFVRAALRGESPQDMATVAVRRAVSADASAIAEVHVRSWRAAYRGLLPDALLDALSVAEREVHWQAILGGRSDERLTVVAGDGALAGFCSAATSRDGKVEKGEIGALYVDPGSWRRGVGTALLTSVLQGLGERGCRDAILWVLPENHGALAFYDRFGFVVENGVRRVEERSSRPVIRLRLELTD
jgi:GrpB-like predicted nucleotidyltransferase (UPF0157 family)/ribosomal protein S18 acetylase RimI-like enzyme